MKTENSESKIKLRELFSICKWYTYNTYGDIAGKDLY